MADVRYSFEGDVAVVTGAARGIGMAAACAFLKGGAKVALLDRDAEELKQGREKLSGESTAYECDVTDLQTVYKALDDVRAHLGEPTILVNSAGMSARVPAEEYKLEDFDRLMTLNVRALFALMQTFAAERIAKKRGGAIVNLASIFGMIADPLSAPYAASKGAVIQLTKTCAVEWARHGIRVNAVAPGYTYTAMTAKTLDSEEGKRILEQVPMKRAATVEEIANAVLFLASPASSFITGQTLVVDGGRTAL
jgi:NAD(P)-dependent dehydrogenase (short-subunit alcohol dehydrogenase family)